jgi:N-acetylneuraminate synthase
VKLIAEIGASHNGSLTRALETIRQVNADYVKFQTWSSDAMAVSHRLTEGPWAGYDLPDLYRKARTPWKWHRELFQTVEDCGMIPFSTPFDIPSVDFLEGLNCPMYKIASYELVDLRLVEYVAMTGKPIVMSCGQAARHEIRAAVWSAMKYTSDITLLHCVSEYPTPPSQANLKTMQGLKECFPYCAIGLSDHSMGPVVPLAATVLGASLIEKHVTLSRDGLDGGFAMLPEEFNVMAANCYDAAAVVGKIRFAEGGDLRRSLYFSQDLKAGTVLDHRHVKTARPNKGLSPVKIEKILGHELTEDVGADQAVKLSCIR